MDCRTTPVIASSYLDIQVASSWLHLYPSFCIFFAPVPPPWFSFYNVWLDDFQPFKLSSKLILKQEAAVLLALKCVLKWTGVTWQDVNDCLQKLQPPTLYVHFNDSLWKLQTLKCLVLNVATGGRRFLSVEMWSKQFPLFYTTVALLQIFSSDEELPPPLLPFSPVTFAFV